jgi:hypothetical protein
MSAQNEFSGEASAHRRHTDRPPRQAQPALPRSDIGDVGAPNRVGCIDGERALQMIGRNDGRATSYPARRLISVDVLDLVFAREALDTMKSAALARFSQIAEHSTCAMSSRSVFARLQRRDTEKLDVPRKIPALAA